VSSIGFGSALSMHPVPAHATGEVVGDVLEAVGHAPTLAVLFVTQPLTGTFDDIADSVQRMLQPEHLVAVTTGGVLGAGSEVEDGSALALWAVRGGSVERSYCRDRPSPRRTVLGIKRFLTTLNTIAVLYIERSPAPPKVPDWCCWPTLIPLMSQVG
jgi:small ligand-binding sensory domain FIST